MKKQGAGRRKHTAEFKAEAVALAGKREKPASHAAVDLGVNESMLRRWTQEARESAETGRRFFRVSPADLSALFSFASGATRRARRSSTHWHSGAGCIGA